MRPVYSSIDQTVVARESTSKLEDVYESITSAAMSDVTRILLEGLVDGRS